MAMLGIGIPAAAAVPPNVIARCQRALEHAQIAIPHRIHFQTQCPGEFSRSKTRNLAILALAPTCDKIIFLDVDLIVPRGLIEFAAAQIRDGRAVWCPVRDVPDMPFEALLPLSRWMHLQPRMKGTGGFLGMTTADWFLCGGWDERLTGWGGEDNALMYRRAALGIETLVVVEWPLLHVRHAPYDPGNRRNDVNMRLAKSLPPVNHLVGRLPTDVADQELVIDLTRCDLKRLVSLIKESKYPQFRRVVLVPSERAGDDAVRSAEEIGREVVRGEVGTPAGGYFVAGDTVTYIAQDLGAQRPACRLQVGFVEVLAALRNSAGEERAPWNADS